MMSSITELSVMGLSLDSGARVLDEAVDGWFKLAISARLTVFNKNDAATNAENILLNMTAPP